MVDAGAKSEPEGGWKRRLDSAPEAWLSELITQREYIAVSIQRLASLVTGKQNR
jgi:hypothetical protein